MALFDYFYHHGEIITGTRFALIKGEWYMFKQLLWCFLIFSVFTAQADDFFDPEHKVVLQVSTNDLKTHQIALNNAVNLQKAYGMDNVAIELVAYGPGLHILVEQSLVSARVSSLALQNITFSACGNTIEKWTKKHGKAPVLAEGVGIVPSGAVRIVELQEQSYAYIRP